MPDEPSETPAAKGSTPQPEPPAEGRTRRKGTAGKDPRPGRSHRTLKLMPGGEEGEGHPLTPEESRRARAAREHILAVFDPTSGGVPAWRVEGASGQHYRVLVPGFPDRDGAQCSCPDFLTRGLGTCKHLEATLAQAAAAPPESLRAPACAPAQVTWARIDAEMVALHRRMQGPAPMDRAELLVALRRLGACLFEPA